MKIYVSGIGVISALGNNVNQNHNALKQKNSGIKFSEKYNIYLGQVNLTNQEMIEQLSLPQEDFSRATLLGIMAAREAWGNSEIHSSIRTGLFSSTSVGGIDKMEKYYLDSKNNNSNFNLMTFENGGITERIAMDLKITGIIGTISTACSSGVNAIMYGARLIKAGYLDRVLVGGLDPIADFNVNGFKSLGICDKQICKPFDDNRNGLTLGEGAAFLLLENEKSLNFSQNKPLTLVSGWDNSTDAYHQTASSPEGIGATLTMKNAIQIAKLNKHDINYINAHGTGTGNNDLSESKALSNVFGNNIPPFSSTKGYTGHTLAAAGAIESVYSVLSIIDQSLIPNINFSTPMKETGFIPVLNYEKSVIKNVITNSFGFGGNCTSLIFSVV